jgi:hypothetical protein
MFLCNLLKYELHVDRTYTHYYYTTVKKLAETLRLAPCSKKAGETTIVLWITACE